MKIKNGNLWDNKGESDIICITTNGILNKYGRLIMGAGVALQACFDRPDLPSKLGEHVKLNGNVPLLLLEEKILSFPTKNHWKDNSLLTLIEKSALKCQEISDNYPNLNFFLPPAGCGNGNLEWSDVEPILSRILSDKFTVVLK